MPDKMVSPAGAERNASVTLEARGPTACGVVPPGPQPCELRWERPIEGDAGGGIEIVCMAAEGKRLAVKGGDERELLTTCGSCTIPRESGRRPCLYLVPIKTERDQRIREYFICRWFYSLKPEKPATTTDWMCGACPYWFPRPSVHLLKDLGQVTQKMIRYHQDAWAGRLPPSPFSFWSGPWSPPVSCWKRVLRPLVSLVSGWWGPTQPQSRRRR
jgi:hypothetical protein